VTGPPSVRSHPVSAGGTFRPWQGTGRLSTLPIMTSSARTLLEVAGVTVHDVAAAAGCPAALVEAQLAGVRPLDDEVLDAIRALCGSHVAEEITALVARERLVQLDEIQHGRL
jgi:3-oxoacyl-ACP reductase-like protein